jgi:hypothetical protein
MSTLRHRKAKWCPVGGTAPPPGYAPGSDAGECLGRRYGRTPKETTGPRHRCCTWPPDSTGLRRNVRSVTPLRPMTVTPGRTAASLSTRCPANTHYAERIDQDSDLDSRVQGELVLGIVGEPGSRAGQVGCGSHAGHFPRDRIEEAAIPAPERGRQRWPRS